MDITYNQEGLVCFKGITLNKDEVLELKVFLSQIIVADIEKLKTRICFVGDEKRKKLLEMVESGEVNKMTLREIAKKVGYNHPQSVKYVLDRLKGK